jgi:hypothetical protein
MTTGVSFFRHDSRMNTAPLFFEQRMLADAE